MIYFFDIDLKLKKIVTPESALEAIHEHELNNMILGSMTMDLAYAKRFIDDVDHYGYYWRGNFYLHRIRRVEDSHINETVTVTGRHIFFEDMLYGLPIDDFRPQNRDASYILRNTIDTNTRWQTVMTDVTGTLSTNFYRQVPWDVIEWVTENFRVEFEPVILFDGQKINGYQLHVANKLGVNKHKRIPFSRVTELDYEIDYSEIITSLAGYGKGEEVGEGHGRRINIADVDFSKNGVVSPLGSHYMEDANITAIYGKDNGEPKYAVDDESFTDIENPNVLANAMYEAYLERSRPKMVFSASVIDVGDVGIGDTQTIARPEYDVFYSVRIHKLTVDLHAPEDAQVELGDYDHFKESKAERAARRSDEAWKKRHGDAIAQLKREWDADYDGMVEQIKQGYEQAVIDANANIQAAEVRMQEELDTQRQAMINNIEQAEQDAKDAAAQNLADTTERINTTIDTTRTDLERDISQEVQSAKDYADTQATAKADSVQSNLDSFKTVHQQLYNDATADIMNIDEFLGDISNITLDERLQEMNMDFEDRIRNININTANMLQGTRFDEPGKIYTSYGGTELYTTSDINRIRIYDDTGRVARFSFAEPVKLEANTDYYVVIEYRTFTVPEIDYFAIETPDGYVRLFDADSGEEGFSNLITDGVWNQATIRLNEPEMLQGLLHIGARPRGENNGVWVDVRQPYMTNTSNRRWIPHPNDATQSIEQITRRITELEDGRTELITRSEYDFDTGQVDQTIRDIEERVDVSRNMIVDIENYDVIQNGSEVMQTVRGFNQKVWDTTQEIGANLIPQSANAWEEGTFWSSGANNNGSGGIRTKEYIEVIPGQQYTFQDESAYVSSILEVQIAQWNGDTRLGITDFVNRGSSRTFTAEGDRIRIGLTPIEGFGIAPRFIDHVDERIQMKLEKGATATPMMNAISHIEQLANEASIAVQSFAGGDVLTQSDLTITADYWQLGSKRVDGDTVASVLRGTPGSIDAIMDEMNLTGNLNVKGQIESISMSAVNANISELRTNILTSDVITSDMIKSKVVTSDKILFGTGLAEDIVASNIVSNHITSRSLEAIEANFGRVQTAILKSNVITSDMIGSNVIRAEHIFVQNAMIEDIVNMNLFTDNVKAMSIDAIYADLRSVNSEIMTSNIIKSNWLNVDTALFERFTSSEAFIDRLTVKAANVRDLQAITVDAVQANLTTIMNSMGQVEGGLTIRRPDGAVWVQNGVARGHIPVQVYEASNSEDVGFTDFNYFTGSSFWQRIKFFYTPHEGTRLRVTWAVGLYDGPSTIEYMEVRVRTFSGYSPINMGNGTSARRATITKGETTYITQDIPMPPPEYREMAAYLEFRRAPDGQSINNRVYARLLFIGQYE